MARKKRNRVVGPVTITDIAVEGKSVGRFNDLVIFAKGAVPGDVVDVLLKKKRTSWAEGEVFRFHEHSPDKIPAFCEHFGTCGGCKWQHLSYEKQLSYKQQQVVESFRRIARVEEPPCLPVLGAEKTRYYRNKLEFSFTENRWLSQEEVASGQDFDRRGAGFNLAGHFDRVLDITHCYLQAEPSNDIRLFIRNFGIQHDLPFFNNRQQEGFLRNVMIRTASTGQVMVLVQFFEDRPVIAQLMDGLRQRFPQITSLYYVVNQKGNDTIFDQELLLAHGQPWITEKMEGLQFRIGPKSFFQTNTAQALALYRAAREFAGLTGNEVAYDLYTGTGTIALFMARFCKEVIGLEYVPEAIEDAKSNAALNGIANARFYAGDIKDLLTQDFLADHPRPDVIITDPPRAGMHKDVVNMLLQVAAPRIVYVSCNPGTQARDVQMLSEKYQLLQMQPVDMFPQTWHIENIALLELKG